MLAEIPLDVMHELLDPRYANRTHGKKATSAKGCRGPLCRKGERDAKARERRDAALKAGREYKPIKYTIGDIHRNELLERIQRWHETMRTVPDAVKLQLSGKLREQIEERSIKEEVA